MTFYESVSDYIDNNKEKRSDGERGGSEANSKEELEVEGLVEIGEGGDVLVGDLQGGDVGGEISELEGRFAGAVLCDG